MMMTDYRQHGAKRPQWGTNAFADYRMLSHEFPFVWRQTGRFQDDCIGYSNLSYVVDDASATKSGNLIFWYSEMLS
ncbi:MAG: hypothetical protein AUG89_08580 [Acidobacteria bacterium 13_1_20CM_4_56_7]|nr:MAG: hypothetical protein AUG89_08580 [Acidobacteria bacterium 13_1_20CM_4_56_7]